MNSKLSPFIIYFNFNIFKFIWQHHVPVNEFYIFSVPHLKVVTATWAYLETHIFLMIITNVNLMTPL